MLSVDSSGSLDRYYNQNGLFYSGDRFYLKFLLQDQASQIFYNSFVAYLNEQKSRSHPSFKPLPVRRFNFILKPLTSIFPTSKWRRIDGWAFMEWWGMTLRGLLLGNEGEVLRKTSLILVV